MDWVKLTEDNEPQGEVLAANFKPGTYGYKEKVLGYVSKGDDDTWSASGDGELLENVTHFIDLKPFDIKP